MLRSSRKAMAQSSLDEQLMLVAIFWHGRCISIGVNQITIMNNQFESNYAMLVRSEEKGRGILEILVYAVFALSIVLSICQFAGA